MKWIGERISYLDQENKTTVVISAEQVGWIKGLIGAWFFMWVAIGLTIIWSVFTFTFTQQEQLLLLVFMSFWVYYFVRVGRSFLWLTSGQELIKLDKIGLSIKTSLRGYGKSKMYFLENIERFQVHTPEANSLQSAWENSPWIRGGERIEFTYMGKNIRFGRKLKEKDAKLLFQVITKRIEDHLKKKI